MEKAIKVLSIICLVVEWIGLAVIIICSLIDAIISKQSLFLLSNFAVVPLAFLIKLTYLNIQSVEKLQKQIWIGVLDIIFVFLPLGIVYLCWQPSATTLRHRTLYGVRTTKSKSSSAIIDPAEALKALKKLYALGILTNEQYLEKVSKYAKFIPK